MGKRGWKHIRSEAKRTPIAMTSLQPSPLYPLRFDPIFQYRIWGGRRLAKLLSTPLPEEEPIGEAWLLSDREDHASVVAEGSLKGLTLGQLFKQSPREMLGSFAGRFDRFPLLLKFLDARDVLSVQVHPSDTQTDYLPKGESGKTEAWIVLEDGPNSRVYAGLTLGTTRETLQTAIANGNVADSLASFTPKPGDGVFIPAGTVHSFGDMLVFEVQENSDVTFRLFDWNHIDTKTGQPRPLQVDQAMACIDFKQGALAAVVPVIEASASALRERMFECKHFSLWRISGDSPFKVGAIGQPRVLVCIEGDGYLEHEGNTYAFVKGDTLLLPAVVGACVCQPKDAITVLEISLPETA